MKPQDDLHYVRLSCSICQPKPARVSKAGRKGACIALALVALLAAAKIPAQQQPQDPVDQYGPPDDSGPNGQPAPIPQYGPNQQYGYSQPQYPQAYSQQPYANPQDSYTQQQNYGPTQPPLSPDDLTQLVAPIALYPDALIAQILAAATYPAQVSVADQWRRSMGNAPSEQIAAGANAQTSWDPSIKALTAFPQVLDMLAGNLQWTTALGNAYYNQPQDVLQTIQVMRQRAQDAGTLQSTPQEDVTNNQGYIDIAPANPQVVYVPTYNPWVVYGAPVAPYPGFSFMGTFGSFVGSAVVQYGLGFAMTAFLHTPWGFLGWGLDWLTHAVLFNHNDYCTRSTSVRDWGFPHGGPRAFPGNPQWVHGDRYGWSHGGYNRAYSQPNNGFNRGNYRPIGGPTPRFGDARTAEGFNRGFPSRSEGGMRPTPPQQLAFNGRQEQPGHQGYDPRNNYASRSGMAFAAPSQAYRAPQNTYERGGLDGRGYESYRGTQAWNQERSGGSHLFGGGHNSEGFGGSAPRAYAYNGGHSQWAGSSGWKAPRMPSESHFGGGHSFSGGHFSGGGHSGGGHSSGGGHGHHH